MPHDLRALALTLLATSLLACSSSDFAIGEQGADTAVIEDDAQSTDTSVGPDTQAPPDDTSAPPPDTTGPDTRPIPDTSVPDTIVVDTSCSCPIVGDCQIATCAGSMCNVTNRPASTACAGGKCNGSGKCVQCVSPSDCAPSAPFCTTDGKCVQCLNATHCPGSTNECKQAACNSGFCAFVPKPRDTLCNGLMDQCDGAGNCVDCTNSGGCGECCTCSSMQTCIPA